MSIYCQYAVTINVIKSFNSNHKAKSTDKISFECFQMNYAAGYGMAVLSHVQLFFICELGDRVEVSNLFSILILMREFNEDERFVKEIECFFVPQENGFVNILYDSNWYTLPLKHQKDLMRLIDCKQHGRNLTIGPFKKIINRQLFKEVSFFVNNQWSHEWTKQFHSLHTQITNNVYTFVMFLMNFTEWISFLDLHISQRD